MIPAETATKLAKIIPRFASAHEGEILNTVSALGRVLASAGLDWHALAAAVEKAGTSGITLGGLKTEPFDWSGFEDFAANWAETASGAQARPDPDAPEAMARKRGYPIWGTSRIEPWSVVAGHCLQLDWYVPKACGGRFLTKEERGRLRDWERTYAVLTNAEAAWVESVVIRCHAARDTLRARDRKAAA